MTDQNPAPADTKTDVITAAAKSIDHSRWGNRLLFMHWTTAAVLVILGGAVFWSKGAHAVSVVAGLFVVNAVLMVVTPSAEQITKMLAQVAAIRFGVGKREEPTQ